MGPQIVQIGTDGGLLDVPVPIVGKLLLAPGERADVVVDFTTSAPGQVWTIRNSAKVPFPGGTAPNGATTGRLMQFIVNGKMVSKANPANPGIDKSLLPLNLRSTPLVRLTNFAGLTNVTPIVKRQLTLNEVMGMGGPLEILVNNSKWVQTTTETPVEGTTELWQIINLTADAHPMHLHLVQFQLVSRQAFDIKNYNVAYNTSFGGVYIPAVGPPLDYNTANLDGAVGGNPAVTQFLKGKANPATPNEMGWKDTYIAYPGEVTTFIIRFAPTTLPLTALPSDLVFGFDPSAGPGYVWHCHIIDHEDNEMMRPYSVLPSPVRSGKGTAALLGYKGNLIQGTNVKALNDVTGVVLEQNYPNPFNDETTIGFNIPEAGHMRLTLYNQLGEPVKVLVDSEAPAGMNMIKMNRENLRGGVYYYKLETGLYSGVKKMIIAN